MQGETLDNSTGKVDYKRNHLRPIAKSVYQNAGVIRLNGSLNGAIGSTGLHMMENSKGLLANNMQQ